MIIKNASSAGDWYFFDSVRGVGTGSDPFVRLNSSSVESACDALDSDSSGFVVKQESVCNLNVTGQTYVFLAIS